jgi:pimeloyl-ACP methyl ester carboxylesterase
MYRRPPLATSLIDEGRGPALLFLHHFGGSGRSWRGVIDRLSGRHRCIAPDLPGFGRAAGHSGPFTTGATAAGIVALIERLGLEDYRIIGHSMGGKIALAVAALQPYGLRGLILVAPSPPTPEPIGDADRAHLLGSSGDQVAMAAVIEKIIVRRLSPSDYEQQLTDMLAASKPAWEAWLNQGSREDISASLAKIRIPITIVSGDGDETIPADVLRRELLQQAPTATLEMVAAAGHLLPVEARDEVAFIIQRVIGRATGGQVTQFQEEPA